MDTGAQDLYIAATDAASGKTAIVLGVAEALSRRVQRLGVFRPVVDGGPVLGPALDPVLDPALGPVLDPVVELIRTRYRIAEPYDIVNTIVITAVQAQEIKADESEPGPGPGPDEPTSSQKANL